MTSRTSRWLLAACLALGGAGEASATLTLSESVAPSFGVLLGGGSGRQFVLGTNGVISGANASDALSGAAAGELTVSDDAAPSTAVIVVENVVPSGGIAVESVQCSHAGGADQDCEGAGIVVTTSSSSSLRIGLSITTTQAHGGSDAATIGMDVTIAYQ